VALHLYEPKGKSSNNEEIIPYTKKQWIDRVANLKTSNLLSYLKDALFLPPPIAHFFKGLK